LKREDDESTEVGDLSPSRGVAPVTRIGDLFHLGSHRVICGDATDPAIVSRLMQGRVARLVLTDEPFNVPISGHVTGADHRDFVMASGEMTDDQFLEFNRTWIGALLPHLVDGGIFGTFIDWRGLPIVHAAATGLGLSPLNLVVWAKTNAGMGSLYRSQHELLPLFKKGHASHVNNIDFGRRGRHRSNVWTYPGASSYGSDARRGLRDHPTVKPVAMLRDALIDLSHRDEIILEPFGGSGSTLIACEKTGRVCRCIEIDPLYVDVIIRRYQKITGQKAVLEEAGETFDELENRAKQAGHR
jgi:DNA modification methylase